MSQAPCNIRPNLGKWRDDLDYTQGRGFWLQHHIQEVLLAMNFLFSEPFHSYKAYASMGHALYDIMNLGRHRVSFDQYRRWCFLGALAHDLGKCSGEFQEMLWQMEHEFQRWHQATYQERPPPEGLSPERAKAAQKHMQKHSRHVQHYRHELLSAFMLYHEPSLKAWFIQQAGDERGWAHVLVGAFGHHLKAYDEKAYREVKGLVPRPAYINQVTQSVRDMLMGLGNALVWNPDTEFPVVPN